MDSKDTTASSTGSSHYHDKEKAWHRVRGRGWKGRRHLQRDEWDTSEQRLEGGEEKLSRYLKWVALGEVCLPYLDSGKKTRVE